MTLRLTLDTAGTRVLGMHLPYERSIRWSDNVPEHGGTYALLRLQTREGLVGVGEATLKPIWTGSSLRSIVAGVEDVLLPRLAGVDLCDAAAVAAALAPIPDNMAGKTLIDNACWDLRAQAADMPLWKLLGGTRDVAMSWTLTRDAPEAMTREAVDRVQRHGFRTLKIKGGQGIATDARAVRSIREALGGDVTIYVDANWQYGPEEGLAFAHAIAAEGAALIEDPWTLRPDEHLRRASAELPVPILVDYFCSGTRDAPMFMDHGARAFSVKPGRIGISEALAMSALCKSRDAKVVVGMFAETPIGSLHTLSFAATASSSPAFAAESSFFLMFDAPVLTAPLTIEHGRTRLPDTPGFAPLVDWKAVERFLC